MSEKYDKELLQKLAQRIKSRREELAISQENLASKCGFDRTYISLLERCKRNPSFLSLIKLSRGLELDIEKLIGGLDGKDI